jgi:hypothetical protein
MGGFVVRIFVSVVLLAACGKVTDNKVPDGGTGEADAGSDASVEPKGDAVVVTNAALFGGTVGAKVGNIDIVSNMPDGSMLATAKTDAGGSATIQVHAGGSVTAIYRHTIDQGTDLITWASVKPGDRLTFGNRNFSTAGQQNTNLGNQTYSWPALANAMQYQVWTPCNIPPAVQAAPGTSLQVPEFSVCRQDPMTVVFSATDSNNTLIGFGLKTVAFQSGKTVALDAWSAPATATVTVTGLPAEVSSLTGTFRAVVDPRIEYAAATVYAGSPTGGAYTGNFAVAQTGLRTVAFLSLFRGGRFRNIQLLDALSLGTLSQTVAAPPLPPWTQNAPTVNIQMQMASWAPEALAGSTYNGQLLHLSWTHIVAGVTSTSQWDMILPSGPMSMTFPALPTALAEIAPTANDTVNAKVRMFDIPSVAGYDALRATPSANVMCLECAVRTADFQRVVFTETGR